MRVLIVAGTGAALADSFALGYFPPPLPGIPSPQSLALSKTAENRILEHEALPTTVYLKI
ncbi:MAG: hypothetical protein EXS30_01925 [Pedosphaera sp.]|nr:hypothetical protein [Pedosphaera sp.]